MNDDYEFWGDDDLGEFSFGRGCMLVLLFMLVLLIVPVVVLFAWVLR